MKKKSLNVMWTMLTASAMFFAGCSNDNEGQTNEVKGKADLTIQLTNAGISRASTGTEPGTDAEKEVKNYEVWVYQTADITANPATAAPVGHKTLSNGSSTILANMPATGVRVVVATNYSSEIDNAGTMAYGTLVEKMASYIYVYPTATTQPATGVSVIGFEMSGMQDASLQADQTNTVQVGLKRLVSKHSQPSFATDHLEDNNGSIDYSELNDLFGLTTGGIDGTTIENVMFEAKGYTLVNGNDKSKLFEAGTWIPELNNHLISSFDTGGDYESNYTVMANRGFLTYVVSGTTTPVYAFENTPLKANIDGDGNLEILADQTEDEFDGYHNQTVYAFVIEGELTYGGTTITRYWRVNIAKTTGAGAGNTADNYTIYRNGAYKVTVSNIYSIGYNTPKEAEESEPVIPPYGQTNIKVDLDVLDWDIYTENTSM